MKVYRGVVKGNTVLLEESPDLPVDTPALVEIRPLTLVGEEAIVARQLSLLAQAPKVGPLLYRKREEIHDR